MVDPQAAGYAWAKENPQAATDKMTSYQAHIRTVVRGTDYEDDPADEPGRAEMWLEWRRGVEDALEIRLTVADIEAATGFNRSYIKAEIARGNLCAKQYGGTYLIRPSAFDMWMSRPRRGSRSNGDQSAG